MNDLVLALIQASVYLAISLGLSGLAYTLGFRHGFKAGTRKMMVFFARKHTEPRYDQRGN